MDDTGFIVICVVIFGGMLLLGIGLLKLNDWTNANKEKGVGKYAHAAKTGLCWLYVWGIFRRTFWE